MLLALKVLSAVLGVAILGNFAYQVLTARKNVGKDPPENTSESVWHDGR